MKFRVMMKDPDCLHEAIVEAVTEQLADQQLTEDEQEAVVDLRVHRIKDLCEKKWFRYGEYLEVEIDTEAGTCTVVPNGG